MNFQRKEKIERAFDKGAPSYDWAALIQREVAEKLINFLPEKTPKNILEIGCGTGILTKMLLKKYPEAQITAFDISGKMIEKSRKKFPFINFVKADGEIFEPEDKFDLIISSMTIQWFENPSAGINRYKEFLNNDGIIYYSTLGENNFKEWNDVLEKQNISSNKQSAQNYEGIIEEENKHTMYHEPFDFVRSLKAIGAHYSAAKPLSPQQLKQVCAMLKSDHCCSITWHILYGALDASGRPLHRP